MPTPRKVDRNSKGEGGFKCPIFFNESMTLNWNFERVGGFKLKNLLWEGYGYFLEQHMLCCYSELSKLFINDDQLS